MKHHLKNIFLIFASLSIAYFLFDGLMRWRGEKEDKEPKEASNVKLLLLRA